MSVRDLLKEVLMGARRPKSKQDHVDAAMKACRCLVPGCTRSMREPGASRGRCSMHYHQFARSLMNLPREEKVVIELRAVRQGTLLESHEIRQQSGAKAS